MRIKFIYLVLLLFCFPTIVMADTGCTLNFKDGMVLYDISVGFYDCNLSKAAWYHTSERISGQRKDAYRAGFDELSTVNNENVVLDINCETAEYLYFLCDDDSEKYYFFVENCKDGYIGYKTNDHKFENYTDSSGGSHVYYDKCVEDTSSVFYDIDRYINMYFQKSSVWSDAQGNFNTARLISDSVAGVVLGTVGGLVTSRIIKQNQIKKGFETFYCTIGGQNVANLGDEFEVSVR